jgi:hypothetical protein
MGIGTRKTLTAIVVIASLGIGTMLSGCGYNISQKGVDEVVKAPVEDWVKYTDNSMKVHQLIKEGKYQEAQSEIEKYLRQQATIGAEYKGAVKESWKVSKETSAEIGNTIETQIQKINDNLK